MVLRREWIVSSQGIGHRRKLWESVLLEYVRVSQRELTGQHLTLTVPREVKIRVNGSLVVMES